MRSEVPACSTTRLPRCASSTNSDTAPKVPGCVLNLVTNPVGAFLPASQPSLEADWKRELHRKHGIVFNRLYTITNMPISRYLQYLIDSGNLQGYMDRLVAAFNPSTIDGLMCRTTLSVGWDGRLYDCDFNQMIDLGAVADAPQTIFEATPACARVSEDRDRPSLFRLHRRSGLELRWRDRLTDTRQLPTIFPIPNGLERMHSCDRSWELDRELEIGSWEL